MKKEQCIHCKHEWLPRVPDPKECPNCKRRDWQKKKVKKQEEAF